MPTHVCEAASTRPIIRVLIAVDVRLYREGLVQVLGNAEDIRVIQAVAHIDEALASVAELKPDIVLLDLSMSDALAAVGAIADRSPQTSVVGLGLSETEGDVLASAEAGVAGYLAPDASIEDLVASVTSASRGELHCSPRVAATLLHRVAELATQRSEGRELKTLTRREGDILPLMADGLTNKEIAARLLIEVATVKSHVHNILEKLNARSRGEAAARVRRWATRRPQRSHFSEFTPRARTV